LSGVYISVNGLFQISRHLFVIPINLIPLTLDSVDIRKLIDDIVLHASI
jgi:hypothetical protein